MDLSLRRLQPGDYPKLVAAVREFNAVEKNWTFAFDFDETTDFTEYLELRAARERGERLLDSEVPSTFLVAVVHDAIVGRVSIRHELNEYLRNFGGHIGYAVVPGYRRRGYGSEMLRQSLSIARELGLERVLLTCREDNLASSKIIERNGGVLENKLRNPDTGQLLRRYWIEL